VLLTSGGILVRSRCEDVVSALRHRSPGRAEEEVLSAHAGKPIEDRLRQALRWSGRTVLLSNPPGHTRLRRLISEAFTPRHAGLLRPVATAAEEAPGQLSGRPRRWPAPSPQDSERRSPHPHCRPHCRRRAARRRVVTVPAAATVEAVIGLAAAPCMYPRGR